MSFMSVMMGVAYDITGHFSNTPSPSTRHSYTKCVANQMLACEEQQRIQQAAKCQQRPRAYYLSHLTDMQLETKAHVALENLSAIDGYSLVPFIGTEMYAITWPEGCKFVDNCHHHSRRFFIRFLQSAAVEYRCYGSICMVAPPIRIGDWCV